MPRLENIERFKEILYALGSEPEVSTRRSEAREDDLPPAGAATEAPDDLEDTADASGEPGEHDLDDLLGESSDETPPAAAPAGVADSDLESAVFGFDAEPAAEGPAESLDLGGLFEEGGAEEAPTETPTEPPTETFAAGAPATEDLADLGDFGDLGAAAPDEALSPADAAEGSAQAWGTEAELPAVSSGDIDAAEGLGDFGFGDLAEPPSPEPSEEPAPAPEAAERAPAEEETFAMPDFGAAFTEGAESPTEGLGEIPGEGLDEIPSEGLGEIPTEGAGEVETAGAEPTGGEPTGAEPTGAEPSTEEPFETFGAELESFGSEGETTPAGEAPPEAPESGAIEGGFELGAFDTEGLASEPEAPQPEGESLDQLADGFSLQGLSDELDEKPAVSEPEGEAVLAGAAAEETAAAGTGEVALEDREFRALQRNLEGLPRNLKIAVESLIGEQAYTGEGLRPLLDSLVRGATPQQIAAQVGKITGATIRIPARFQRQTGAEFEEERSSLAYLFRTSVLPILRTVLLVTGVLVILTLGGYELVYKPLYARSLYRAGIRALEQGEYSEAERNFGLAVRQRNRKDWYFRYAEAYISQRRYQDASRKYEQIEQAFGYDKKSVLDHAGLQSRRMGNYANARALLEKITERDFFDRDALLALGDNYLEWARHATATEGETTPAALLERARVEDARVLERHGYRNDVLFRMMRYFVRSDRMSEIRDLREYLESDEAFKPDPDVYAEVGGYLVDKGEVEDARTVLLKASAVSTTIPEIDYHLARLYRDIGENGEEGKALRNALANLAQSERTPEHVFMEIDTRRRHGDWLYRQEQVIEAAQEYREAIDLTEDALSDRVLEPRRELGLPYAGLGDIRFYVESDYGAALDLYLRSRDRGLEDTGVDYRIGYIHYAQGSYEAAVAELVPLQEKLPQNWNVLFATATSLYQRGDYFAAEGYYLRLIDRLLARRDAIRDLRPESNPEHFTLANLLLKAYNNLGVAYYQQGVLRGGRGRELTRALVEITEAAQYLDVIARDPETLERSAAKNLAYLNANALQHPGAGFEPTIYDRIPRDDTADRF